MINRFVRIKPHIDIYVVDYTSKYIIRGYQNKSLDKGKIFTIEQL